MEEYKGIENHAPDVCDMLSIPNTTVKISTPKG